MLTGPVCIYAWIDEPIHTIRNHGRACIKRAKELGLLLLAACNSIHYRFSFYSIFRTVHCTEAPNAIKRKTPPVYCYSSLWMQYSFIHFWPIVLVVFFFVFHTKILLRDGDECRESSLPLLHLPNINWC